MITRLYSSDDDPNLCSLWGPNLTNGDLYESDGRYEIHPAGDVVCLHILLNFCDFLSFQNSYTFIFLRKLGSLGT